jgi:hypothetical protein
MEIGPSVLIVVVLSETRRCEAAGFDRVLYCLAAAEVVGLGFPWVWDWPEWVAANGSCRDTSHNLLERRKARSNRGHNEARSGQGEDLAGLVNRRRDSGKHVCTDGHAEERRGLHVTDTHRFRCFSSFPCPPPRVFPQLSSLSAL